MGSRCVWSKSAFRDNRHTHLENSGTRRRSLDRSDRALTADVSELGAGTSEERQHDSAKIERRREPAADADSDTNPNADTDADADADADADSDPNADADSDSDTDADSDA